VPPIRLQLRRVEVITDPISGKTSATVSLGINNFEHQGYYESSNMESELRIIALATFEAINQVLEEHIDLSLETKLLVVEEMRPVFLEKSLFVVIVDVVAGTFAFKPTGAVVAEHQEAQRAIAAAALDSLNRLIGHLFALNEMQGE
jgi:hypothetical protein